MLGHDSFEGTGFQLGFRSDLEGDPHGTLHGWVGGPGGTMSGMSSPNDPIFFLHHAPVDRMWARWQANGHQGSAFYPTSSSATGPSGEYLIAGRLYDPAQTGSYTVQVDALT